MKYTLSMTELTELVCKELRERLDSTQQMRVLWCWDTRGSDDLTAEVELLGEPEPMMDWKGRKAGRPAPGEETP